MESTARDFNNNVDHALADPNLQDSLSKLKVGFSERRRQAAERLPEFEALRDHLAFGVVEAFVVDALQTVDQAERAGLRQEHRVVDESPECQQAMDAAGVRIVAQDAADAHHDARSTRARGPAFVAS